MAKEAKKIQSIEDIKKDLIVKTNDLLEYKRSNKAGDLANPRVITKTRKEIARLKTAIRADELSKESE